MQEILVDDSWRQRVQELVGRRRDVLAIVAVVGVATLGGLLLAMRPAPKVAPPNRSISMPGETSNNSLLVHVAGAVRNPGLYELPAGARVADAIEAAGGPARRADLDAVNLAELLVDATKIEVPVAGDEAAEPSAAPSSGQPVVDLNTADQVELETIPGVGPVTALAILATRDEAGGFTSIDQLLDVDGIGPATLESIRPYVTI